MNSYVSLCNELFFVNSYVIDFICFAYFSSPSWGRSFFILDQTDPIWVVFIVFVSWCVSVGKNTRWSLPPLQAWMTVGAGAVQFILSLAGFNLIPAGYPHTLLTQKAVSGDQFRQKTAIKIRKGITFLPPQVTECCAATLDRHLRFGDVPGEIKILEKICVWLISQLAELTRVNVTCLSWSSH